MCDTERIQPMRVWAAASGFSHRTFLMSNGRSISPMPSSMGIWCLVSGAKVEPMLGAALRWRQATTLPDLSSPASIRSAETVW